MHAAGQSAFLVAMTLILASCDGPAISPSDSLVGAENLPSSSVLVGENIEISRTHNTLFGEVFHLLSYELRSDNTLTVTHTLRDFPDDREIGQETFQLSSEHAQQVRRKLWRVRPTTLEASSELSAFTRPLGCIRKSNHEKTEISVVFFESGHSSEIDDYRLAVFELPYPNSCNNERAVSARKLIGEVLSSYPGSSVAAGFPAKANVR